MITSWAQWLVVAGILLLIITLWRVETILAKILNEVADYHDYKRGRGKYATEYEKMYGSTEQQK